MFVFVLLCVVCLNFEDIYLYVLFYFVCLLVGVVFGCVVVEFGIGLEYFVGFGFGVMVVCGVGVGCVGIGGG